MGLEFKEDNWNPRSKSLTLSEYVEKAIKDAPDYHAGQIESLEAKIRVMAKLLSAIVGALPEKTAIRLGEKLGLEVCNE